jgi:protein-arginine kinase
MNQEPVECMCGVCKLGKRQWVGLTEEEIVECLDSVALGVVETEKVINKHLNVYNAAKAIEAKLKEKNT